MRISDQFCGWSGDMKDLENLLWFMLKDQKPKWEIVDDSTGEILIPSGQRITKKSIRKLLVTK